MGVLRVSLSMSLYYVDIRYDIIFVFTVIIDGPKPVRKDPKRRSRVGKTEPLHSSCYMWSKQLMLYCHVDINIKHRLGT